MMLFNSAVANVQIKAVAALFGVKASESTRTESFHETFQLTCLTKTTRSGPLTKQGDMVVCCCSQIMSTADQLE